MAGSQLSLDLPDAGTCQPLSGASGWAPLFFPSDFLVESLRGAIVLYPGHGLLAPYGIMERPTGRLSAPFGSRSAMEWGLCGQMSLSALMGASMDFIREWWEWRGSKCGNAAEGSSVLDMLRFANLFCHPTQAFSTTRYDRDTYVGHAVGLQWPICGCVAVTLPDGDLHWVATLNGLVYDCLQDAMIDVIEWDRRNRPYTIDDIIITGPAILRREWSWSRLPNTQGQTTPPESHE